MKAGWKIQKLGALIEIQNGYAFSSKDYAESGFFLMRIGNVQNGFISTEDPKFIKLPADGSMQRFSLSENDILVSLTGNVGRIGVIEKRHLPAALNQRVARITCRKDSPATRDLLLHFLCSDWFKEELIKAGHGAAQQNVSTKDLIEIEIPVPPIEEQHRIVTLLDEAFAEIATAKANAEKNLQNARALFESHLDASFGRRNESWTEKALQDIGSTQTGSTPKTSDQANYGDELPFIKPGDFAPNGTLNYENDGLSAQGAASARKVSANSVLMVCIGATIGKCGYADREIATNQQINAFTPVAGIDKKFIYYQMLTKRFQDRVIHGSGQATLPIINKSKWSALTINLPATLGEQVEIAKKLDAICEETQRLEIIYRQKLTALDDLKKSLLHQAFSGQL